MPRAPGRAFAQADLTRPASLSTPEDVRSLVQVFRRICPAMAVTETVRVALVWRTHPLDAAFAGVFLVITLGVIRLGSWGPR